MKTRLKSPATVLAVVLALLVIASVVIWLQIASHLGIKLLGGQPAESGNNVEPDTSEQEPSMFPSDVIEVEIEEPNLEDDWGISEPETSELEQYPGFRFVNSELDEQAYAYEELAREYLTSICMEEQGWQYFPTTSTWDATSIAGVENELVNSNESFVASLGPSERTAYNLALTGVEDPSDEVDGYAPGLGCMGESHQEFPGVYALASVFTQELTELENQARAEVANSKDNQNEYRRSIIAKQNEFVAKHQATLEEFQASHHKESLRVAQIITTWEQRA
ncbi:hypothetical protein V5R04_11080 [Jonesiaceae bacterium BS-20]|uniref:Uncharacterized protein n=1 Tax=Jonesiaceae bacterium BS-20 TaxID=3120821 RepID=A0AAU7DRD1_9MICO